MNTIRFVCAVCEREAEVFLTKPIQEGISRGVPVSPPSEWGSQLIWKQDPENGRIAAVTLPLCSGVCLNSMHQNPDQFSIQNIWQQKRVTA